MNQRDRVGSKEVQYFLLERGRGLSEETRSPVLPTGERAGSVGGDPGSLGSLEVQ